MNRAHSQNDAALGLRDKHEPDRPRRAGRLNEPTTRPHHTLGVPIPNKRLTLPAEPMSGPV